MPPTIFSYFLASSYAFKGYAYRKESIAVQYMFTYQTKSADKYSNTTKQAMKNAFGSGLDNYKRMKSVAKSHINKRKFGV